MIRFLRHLPILTILLPLLLAISFTFTFTSCTDPDLVGRLHENRMPETRLSNIPPPGTISTSPLVSFSWLGDDADGYVVAYRYRWSFQLSETSAVQHKPYTYILNIMIGGMALIMEGDETSAPGVYRFFSTLPPEGLDPARVDSLANGDTLVFEGVRLFASNPDDVRYPTHESPSRGTFIFDSQDSLNPHTFEVSAIDNLGQVDTSPATIDFFTPIVPPPDVIVETGPNDTVLVLNELTDTYTGTRFTFQGFDPNSRTIEYSWIVDRDLWHPDSVEGKWSPFSLDPTARIKGSDLYDPLNRVDHRLYVRARNEFGSISTRGYFTRIVNPGTDSARADTFWAHRDFRTIYPEFAKPGAEQRILLVNLSYDWDTLAVPSYRPSKSMLLQYYQEMYDALGLTGKYDVITPPVNNILNATWPGLGTFGKYSLIHVVGDVTNPVGRIGSYSPAGQARTIDYCNVGGKMLINGWNMTRGDNMPASGLFWNNIIHILNQQNVQQPPFPTISQYAGARRQTIPDAEQYPDAPLDMTKLDTAWHDALPYFHVYQAYGFGEIIYRYDSKDDLPQWENTVVGIRYIGLTYDVIYIGFPLYYTEQAAAIEVLRKAFRDLKHL